MRAKASKTLVRRAAGTPKRRAAGANARPLLADVRGLILAAREGVARAVNAGLVLLYWEIGRRIRQDILREKRAEYGAQIVQALTAQLSAEFGRGFSRRNLFNMIRFVEVCPDPKIVHALSAQLGWTHVRQIITSTIRSNATSTPKSAGLNDGTRGRWGRRSSPCSSSAPRCRKNRRN